MNRILKELSIYHAIGEVKLWELIMRVDDSDCEKSLHYKLALTKLYSKGLIEIVSDPLNTMSVVRLIEVLH
jgi:hypothetical protein